MTGKEAIIHNCPYLGDNEECVIMTTRKIIENSNGEYEITIKRPCIDFIYCSQKVESKVVK